LEERPRFVNAALPSFWAYPPDKGKMHKVSGFHNNIPVGAAIGCASIAFEYFKGERELDGDVTEGKRG
jgi:hypothetical protein